MTHVQARPTIQGHAHTELSWSSFYGPAAGTPIEATRVGNSLCRLFRALLGRRTTRHEDVFNTAFGLYLLSQPVWKDGEPPDHPTT